MVFAHSTRILIGSIYSGLAVFILPIHLMILSIFIAYKDYRDSAAYKIMLSIGVADCLQLLTHIYTGLITLKKDNFSYGLEQLMGGLANAAWLAMIPQTFVLAFNRFYVFRNPKKNQSTYLVLVMLTCCWIFGGAYFVLYLTDLTGITYDNENFCWGYDSGNWSEIVANVEYYTSVPILCLTFIVYLAVVVTIVIMRSSLTSDKRLLVKREFMLLIQSFVIFLYTVVLICCWHYYMYFLPDSPWTPVVINVFWILFGALNPVLYLTMNSTIRNRFLRNFVYCKRKGNSVSALMPSKQRQSENSQRMTHTATFP